MSIYEAIFDRYSVREYQMEKIEPERLEALKRYLKTVALLDEVKPVEFEIVDKRRTEAFPRDRFRQSIRKAVPRVVHGPQKLPGRSLCLQG